MSEHEKSTRKKSMGAEKFHAFMKNKLAVAGAGLLIAMMNSIMRKHGRPHPSSIWPGPMN